MNANDVRYALDMQSTLSELLGVPSKGIDMRFTNSSFGDRVEYKIPGLDLSFYVDNLRVDESGNPTGSVSTSFYSKSKPYQFNNEKNLNRSIEFIMRSIMKDISSTYERYKHIDRALNVCQLIIKEKGT